MHRSPWTFHLRRAAAAYGPPLLGAMWLAAAWAKFIHPNESISAIRAGLKEFGLVEPSGVRWALVCVIAFEIALGFGLIFGVASRVLLVVSAGMPAAFTVWGGFLAVENPAALCGCGLKLGWWEGGSRVDVALVRNLVLLVTHGFVLTCSTRTPRSKQAQDASLPILTFDHTSTEK